ncbi:MAG: hypothetical protein FWF13_02360 [Acidobacteria bacterium]|nr:hypothetical protein [Acidobacteriota bacterium]
MDAVYAPFLSEEPEQEKNTPEINRIDDIFRNFIGHAVSGFLLPPHYTEFLTQFLKKIDFCETGVRQWTMGGTAAIPCLFLTPLHPTGIAADWMQRRKGGSCAGLRLYEAGVEG